MIAYLKSTSIEDNEVSRIILAITNFFLTERYQNIDPARSTLNPEYTTY